VNTFSGLVHTARLN